MSRKPRRNSSTSLIFSRLAQVEMQTMLYFYQDDYMFMVMQVEIYWTKGSMIFNTRAVSNFIWLELAEQLIFVPWVTCKTITVRNSCSNTGNGKQSKFSVMFGSLTAFTGFFIIKDGLLGRSPLSQGYAVFV